MTECKVQVAKQCCSPSEKLLGYGCVIMQHAIVQGSSAIRVSLVWSSPVLKQELNKPNVTNLYSRQSGLGLGKNGQLVHVAHGARARFDHYTQSPQPQYVLCCPTPPGIIVTSAFTSNTGQKHFMLGAPCCCMNASEVVIVNEMYISTSNA